MNIDRLGFKDPKCISQGSYGHVFKAKDKTGKFFAFKSFKEIVGEPDNNAKTEKNILQ